MTKQTTHSNLKADSKVQDKAYLLKTLSLAEKGRFTCKPNPQVGCILVKDDQVIAEGWHIRAGEGHAEVNAIAQAKQNKYSTEGATAYVSLEPCSFTGKTPPCVNALLDAGVSRVVCASLDPNPKVAGNGIEKLNEQGVSAEVSDDTEVLAKAEWINRGFFKRMRTNTPWVMLKTAATLDGKTADHAGVSQWITSAESRAEVHQLRAQSGAIITGSGTLISDNPQMNARLDQDVKQPIRVLLDSEFKITQDAKILADENVLIFTTKQRDELPKWSSNYQIECIERIDLNAVIVKLAELEVNYVMIETGSILAGAFVEQDLVDEIVHFIAPSILGSQAKGLLAFSNPIALAEKKEFKVHSVETLKNDVKLTFVKV